MATTTTDSNTDNTPATIADAARDVRTNMGAVKVGFRWLGTRRSLSDAQTRQAAANFDADAEQVSAYKKLIDTKHPAYKALTTIKNQVVQYWRGITLPYPTEGVRLLRRDDIETFETKMRDFRERLELAVNNLQLEYESIKTRAREHLGSLYDPADYPENIQDAFGIFWEYPPVEPPRYLMNFNPELYAQEQARIQQRFEQAVAMAENSFADQLQALVAHLIERLTDNPDGSKKTFKSSVVENFGEFYEQFKKLNVRGNTELEALVSRANSLIAGVDVDELRKDQDTRRTISEQMYELQNSLDDLIQNAPRRRVMRMD